jgi:hypothetical protein
VRPLRLRGRPLPGVQERTEDQLSLNDVARFRRAVQTLVGLPCWGIAASRNTGTALDMHFGTKVPARWPIPNTDLPPDLRTHVGELELFVDFASWRLDDDVSVVCCSNDDQSAFGPLERGLSVVVDQTVRAVDLVVPGFDLTLTFDRHVLRVFCDWTQSEDDEDNYWLQTALATFNVGARSVLGLSPRGDD